MTSMTNIGACSSTVEQRTFNPLVAGSIPVMRIQVAGAQTAFIVKWI